MKYLSLFSGIGGFEIGIQRVFPDAKCIGFSEVDKFAIQVYTHHFPDHANIGDITTVQEETVAALVRSAGGCDLIVGGFPCQNLSSMARGMHCNDQGLDGPKSGLFWKMLSVIQWVMAANPEEVKLHILIENNASMRNANKQAITEHLQSLFPYEVFLTKLNGADFGIQRRRRLYWTTWQIVDIPVVREQTWDDVLLPLEECQSSDRVSSTLLLNTGNTVFPNPNKHPTLIRKTDSGWAFEKDTGVNGISRWDKCYHSDTKNVNASTMTRYKCMNKFLIDRRNSLIVRYWDPVEIERLFFIPDGWVSTLCSKSRCYKLLGNTVITNVISYLVEHHPNAQNAL